MAVIATVISVYFYLRVIVMMYFHEDESGELVVVHRGMGAIVAVSSLAILLIGFFPSGLMHLALASIPF
jgi:NADH-quinone oxidoreductase subunit N